MPNNTVPDGLGRLPGHYLTEQKPNDMKVIQKIQTFDGVEHVTRQKADQHLNKLENEVLTRITCDISRFYHIAHDNRDGDIGLKGELVKARLAVGSYILDNMEAFARLQTIQNDRVLTNEDDE